MDNPQPPHHDITVSRGGLTLQVMPTTMRLFWLNEQQLENIATMNLITGISLAFFGICLGGWLTLHATLQTLTDVSDPRIYGKLVAEEAGALILAILFFLIFAVGLGRALFNFYRIKQTGITPTSQ